MNGERANHNGRFWRWVAGVLGTLLVAAVVALFSTMRQTGATLVKLDTRQELMNLAVTKNTKWIADWYAVLKVPERDQHQDSAIEENARRIRVLEQRER